MRRRDLLAAASVLPLALAPVLQPAAQEAAALEAAFAAGGVALLLRHALTEPGIGDPPGYRLDDCRSQRNLSAEGRAQAERLGQELRARRWRFDEVRSSRWCRCVDTARLAFPGREVEVLEALNSFFDDRGAAAARTAALRGWLAQLGRRNAALITHQVNIAALTNTGAAMGEGVILRVAAGELRPLARWPVR